MNSGIYTIRNKVNGRLYVGSAADFKDRWRVHVGELNRGTHHSPWLQRSWKKHGSENFEFSKLLICSKDNLLMYEQLVLDHTEVSYNTCKTAGSRRGIPQPKDAVDRMAAASRKNWEENRDAMLCAIRKGHTILKQLHQDPEYKARHQKSVRQARQIGARTLTYNGETKPIIEWAEQLGMSAGVIHNRMKLGWDAEAILTTTVFEINTPEFFTYRREKRNQPTYQYKGELLGLTELASALGSEKSRLLAMIKKRGVEEAIAYYEAVAAGNRPKTLRNIVCEYNGVPHSLLTLSAVLNAPYVTFNRRVKRYGLDATISHYTKKAI